ncbi:MAG: hypothetical protein F6K32_18865 [Desertifilum sp. SIO1I2]|nr:hypothetical protein [Desertifilum sp. SIO1I2]
MSEQPSSMIPIFVYGRAQCGWTVKLMRELTQQNVPFIFRDIDDRALRAELQQVLAKGGITGRYPLPLVYARSQVMLRPSIEQVKAKL